jgi:lysophospholipid acyltransferase (LPLAT)-like uncharacterized protein
VKLRVPPGAARALATPAMRLLAGSWRISTQHEERWRAVHETRRPQVFLLWHEVLLPLLWHHRRQGVAIVVSENRDGQYLADFARGLGYRVVRGSSSRGAARALLGAVRELRAGYSVAFTPDGPRGPRRELKLGVVAAAQRGGGVIVPVHARADRAWRLDSWDRFLIPKPGARVTVTYGRPFEVTPGDEGLAGGLAEAGVRLAEIAEAGG